MPITKSTCIVGIGNPLRSDDGVGACICRLLEEKNLQDVTFITTQQLDIGIAEDFSKFDRVVLVDASVNETAFSFMPLVQDFNPQTQSFSHQINAGILYGLTQQLFSTNTRFFICAIGANDFEMGDQLSEKTISNALEAVSMLTEWIQTPD